MRKSSSLHERVRDGRVEYGTSDDLPQQNEEWGSAAGLPAEYRAAPPATAVRRGSGAFCDGGASPSRRGGRSAHRRNSSQSSVGSIGAQEYAMRANASLTSDAAAGGGGGGGGLAPGPSHRRRSSQGSLSGFPGRSIRSSVADPLASLPVAVQRLHSGGASGGDLSRVRSGSQASSTSGVGVRPGRFRRRSSDGGSSGDLGLRDSARQAVDHLKDAADGEEGCSGGGQRPRVNKRGSMGSQESITHEMLAKYREAEMRQQSGMSRRATVTPGSAAGAGARGYAGDWRDRRRAPNKRAGSMAKIFDDPATVMGYASVPLLEVARLPRGGLSLDTKAVGRIQFGIPPETIKDSMRLGIEVPRVYIVPVERFCREMGPSLGINVAEFEFPAYFNFFVRQKRCTLIVESSEAEANIRRVFGETLLGPAQFRNHEKPKPHEEEDFDPRYPVAARPNFYNESNYFRTQERTEEFDELCLDMLVEFCHYAPRDSTRRLQDKLGCPPAPPLTPAEVEAMAFYDELNDASDKSGGLVAPDIGESSTSFNVHDSASLLLQDAMIHHLKQEKPKHGKRLHESMKERVLGRRHTTWLDVSDIDESDDDSTSDAAMGSASASRQTDPRGGCGGASCAGCNQCIRFESANEAVPERPKLRRVVSNPDFLSSRNLEVSATAEDTAASTNKTKMVRQKSADSKRTPVFHREDGVSWTSGDSFFPDSEDEKTQDRSSWMYSQAKWLGDVATIYPHSATDEDKTLHRGPRLEIFKMTGGTEYIVHDIDENNIIIGKARFSGTVRVPDEIAVEGFTTTNLRDEQNAESDRLKSNGAGLKGDGFPHDDLLTDDEEENGIRQIRIPSNVVPPTFHPPSFGVTVLGNSHGFDKNGSTSGYVLWVNGRGVMIDPPPYASATLEREGIRSRMIIAIIITHCHADHDAGAFQKVMTGSRVAVITTPTIYKSFIRKYAALSGLNPELLRHSHRHRPAIVGQPLKFQGATFHFTYTLHTIPCIAFKVEWRGRSMVFTGDHMNIPNKIDQLVGEGVLTKERGDSIVQLALQDCDLLLHECGAPPIHTPLDVLLALPEEVKKRLYVVHTSALPKECELRVAPTGTAGTIRLDKLEPSTAAASANVPGSEGIVQLVGGNQMLKATAEATSENDVNASVSHDVCTYGHQSPQSAGDSVGRIPPHFLPTEEEYSRRFSKVVPPLLMLRPTCVSDAWFILNLLSAVPFLSSLSYSNTMEVLETAQVEVFCADEIVIPAHRRKDVLCVVWEGTCIEKEPEEKVNSGRTSEANVAVWHAGDWTGPNSLQPECALSADCSHRGVIKDVVAVSSQGVKVIVVAMKDLHEILKNGSPLYRKYLAAKQQRLDAAGINEDHCTEESSDQSQNGWDFENARSMKRQSVRPQSKEPSLNFMEIISYNSALGKLTALQKRHLESLADGPRYFESGQLIWQVGAPVEFSFLIVSGTAHFVPPQKRKVVINRRGSTGSIALPERLAYRGLASGRTALSMGQDKLIYVSPNSEYARLEVALQLRVEEVETEAFEHSTDLLPREERVRNARDRFANKVLSRLYARHAFTSGIVFSRGHFLSDTSRMVSGSLAFIQGKSSSEFLHEGSYGDPDANHYHTSNIAAGLDGCVVMVFPRESLISFLDAHPGVLLSLLGTQAVV